MNHDQVIIKTSKIHKSFGKKTALKEVDLEIQSGRIVGLLGQMVQGKAP